MNNSCASHLASKYTSVQPVAFSIDDDLRTISIASLLFGSSFLITSVLGLHESSRRTVWLLLFFLITHWQATLAVFCHMNLTSVLAYTTGSILSQLVVASQVSAPGSYSTAHPETGRFPFEPALYECKTRHVRIFPTRHVFEYPYLFVGVPIGWSGRAGSILSISQKTWFAVHADDHLQRQNTPSELRKKLFRFLVSQSIDPDDFKHAYLVTAPRVLGFSFNPVSFWYLYNETYTLAAMILEVNNTFDERRMYFLPKPPGEVTFTQRWQKDFHVSPFNDRGGSYSLKAADPRTDGVVDNTIVLRSGDGKAKVVARVWSQGRGLHPSKMSRLKQWSFVIRWCWTGFLTNPRILKEARVLWSKRLHVFYRPEVFPSSIGRTETSEEVTIETVFRTIVAQLSERSGIPVCYIPAAGSQRGSQIDLGHKSTTTDGSLEILEIRAITPALYSELVRINSVSKLFDVRCFRAGVGEAMLAVSNIELARCLVSHAAALPACTPLPVSLPKLVLRYFWYGARSSFASVASIGRRTPSRETKYDTQETEAQDDSSHFLMAASVVVIADKVTFGSTTTLKNALHVLSWATGFVALSSLDTGWNQASTSSLLFTWNGLVLLSSFFDFLAAG